MPLDYQNVPIALQGIDTKTDERNIISGKFILGENCFMQKSGKIQSRYGYAAGYQGSINHQVGGLMNGVPTAVRAGSIDKLVTPSNSTATNIPLISTKNGVDITIDQLHHDGIFASPSTGTKVMAATFTIAGSSYRVSILDLETMSEITGADGNNADRDITRVTSEGTSCAICFGFGTNKRLYMTTDMTTLTSTVVTPAFGITTDVYDIAMASNGNVGVAWSVAGEVYFSFWNGTTWSTTANLGTITATAIGIAKSPTAGRWNVIACAGTTIKVYNVQANGTLYSTITSAGTGYNTPITAVMAENSDFYYAIQGKTVTGGFDQQIGTYIKSKFGPFFEPCMKIASKCYNGYLTLVNLTVEKYDSSSAKIKKLDGISTYSVYDISSSSTAYAEYMFSYASGKAVCVDAADFGSLPLNKPSFQVGGYFFGARISDYVSSISGTTYTIINTAYRIGAVGDSSWVEYNNAAYTNIFGAIRQIASTSLTPQEQPISYPFAPSMPRLSAVAGTMTVGQYQCVLVYESADAFGRVIRSPVSSPETITLSAPNAAFVVYINTPYDLINSELRTKIAVYITKANETIFYRAGQLNNLSVGSITVSADPTGSEQALYTTGGVLDAGNPGLSAGVFAARDRLWSISAENRNVVYFSELNTPAECPKFNEGLYLNVPDLGGKLIAVAEMDEKILLFKEYAVYVTYGSGPDNLGAGEYPAPQLISQSLGCAFARSVVLTDDGVMFMSSEGIWLMTRGLQMQYVGAPVEAYNTLTITGAMNLVDRHQVWFFSNSGTTIVWDEFHKLWYVFTGQATNVAILQADGKPGYVSSTAGTYLIESKSAVNDNGTTFKMKVKTGWTSLAGIQGFQRFRKLQWSGASSDTLTLKLYYDFDTTLAETFTVTTAAVGTPYQFEVKPARQKCEAIQFEIESAALTGQTSLQTFSIEAGAKKGTNRIAPSKRVQGV